MSWLSVEKAKVLHRRHPGLSRPPVDVESLARAEGLQWLSWPFLEPVREVKQGRWIGLALGLSQPERRYLMAHALAHHVMHVGNQLAFHHQRQGRVPKEEREADECAAHILMPEEELEKVAYMPPWELAEYFEVPQELATRRVTDFATERELARWESARHDYIPE